MKIRNNLLLGIGILHVVISIIASCIPLWTVNKSTYNYSSYSATSKDTVYYYNVYVVAGNNFNKSLAAFFVFALVVMFALLIMTLITSIVASNGSAGAKKASIFSTVTTALLFFVFMIVGFVAAPTFDNTSGSYSSASAQVGTPWGYFPFMMVLSVTIGYIVVSQKTMTYIAPKPATGPKTDKDYINASEMLNVGDFVKTKYASKRNDGSVLRSQSKGQVVGTYGDGAVKVKIAIDDAHSETITYKQNELLKISASEMTLADVNVLHVDEEEVTKKIEEEKKEIEAIPSPKDDGKVFGGLQGAQRILDVYEDRVVLTQVQNLRSLITHDFFNGTKEIPFASMSSVQFKEGSSMILGYIQFEVPGVRTGSNFGSENSWTFYEKDNAKARRVCEYCKKRVMELKTPQQAAPQQVIQQHFSVADELLKFKQLLDMGAITQEEFDTQKKKLLNS